MAGNNDFSRALMEALMQTFSDQDSQSHIGSDRQTTDDTATALRLDLRGVTIERMVLEVPHK